jgi:hypothetical protein
VWTFKDVKPDGSRMVSTYWCEASACQQHARDWFEQYHELDHAAHYSTFTANSKNNPQLVNKACLNCHGSVLAQRTIGEVVNPVLDLEHVKRWAAKNDHAEADEVVTWLIGRVEELESEVQRLSQ